MVPKELYFMIDIGVLGRKDIRLFLREDLSVGQILSYTKFLQATLNLLILRLFSDDSFYPSGDLYIDLYKRDLAITLQVLFRKEKERRGINKRYLETRGFSISSSFFLLYTAISAFYIALIPRIGRCLREELYHFIDIYGWYKVPNRPRDSFID